MRINDPAVIRAIEQLEQTAVTLRRLAGLPALNMTPADPVNTHHGWHDCIYCNSSFPNPESLASHFESFHAALRDPAATKGTR